MREYLDVLHSILSSPFRLPKATRTGIDTISLTGVQFVHDMGDGFPLLTTKKMPMKVITAELEFFIKGLSDKRWLQERGCHIWDEWGNPKKVKIKLEKYQEEEKVFSYPPSTGLQMTLNKTHELQKEETDLGRIYGVQWRNWKQSKLREVPGTYDVWDFESMDQLKNVIESAKKDPLDRRLLVSAWRPDEFDEMALPPCHDSFQILSDGTYLDLIWRQRSVDAFLGLPFNIASYGLLLTLLGMELYLIPRRLVGHLGDVHIYENHMEQVKIQLDRQPQELPQLVIPAYNKPFDIFKWDYDDFKLNNYNPQPSIKAEVAV